MTTIYSTKDEDPIACRYWDEMENALMAQAIADATDLPAERSKALRRLWALGTFNFAACGLAKGPAGAGALDWATDGTEHRLLYQSPFGMTCHLARVYRQPNDTWAALIVAGVRGSYYEAMAAAEWGIACLTG
jgi:hypothetical protein